jgi:hypothetical protein
MEPHAQVRAAAAAGGPGDVAAGVPEPVTDGIDAGIGRTPVVQLRRVVDPGP